MCHLRYFGISVALLGTIAQGQTPSSDSQTLQALLAEVRQLRQVLQTTTIAAQRIQLTLYRLQIQGTTVARATQRLDETRFKVTEAEFARKRLVMLVENLEDLQSHTENQQERSNRDVDLRREKKELELQTSEEQQLRAIENDAFAQVEAERTKLNELEDGLDRLEKALEDFGAPKR